MITLDVVLGNERIGTLSQTRKGARFRYDEQSTDRHLGEPLLSASLPVKAKPYNEGLTGAWFENLLPEGERLMRLCKELKCSPADYVRILRHIGWECAGAVSVLPRGETPTEEAGLVPLSSDELAERLRNLPVYDASETLAARVSLGGFQEKMIVHADALIIESGFVSGGRFALPQGSALSTHILKPQLASKYPHLIESEAWAMTTASFAARCSTVALMRFDEAPLTLVVQRFDRTAGADGPMRLHQEDCCQALGLPPSMKYASSGTPKGDDPSYGKIAERLRAYAIDYEAELTELLRQMTVNLLLGNVDAHAKNYAFLYPKACRPTLSPLYDVTPVQDIEPMAKHLSLRVNGKIVAEEVGRDDIIAEAASWGLPREHVKAVLLDTMENLVKGLAKAESLYPDAAARFAPSAVRRVNAMVGE